MIQCISTLTLRAHHDAADHTGHAHKHMHVSSTASPCTCCHKVSWVCYLCLQGLLFLCCSDRANLRKETLEKQFEVVKERVSRNGTYMQGSHVLQFGSLSIDEEPVADYLGDEHTGQPECHKCCCYTWLIQLISYCHPHILIDFSSEALLQQLLQLVVATVQRPRPGCSSCMVLSTPRSVAVDLWVVQHQFCTR